MISFRSRQRVVGDSPTPTFSTGHESVIKASESTQTNVPEIPTAANSNQYRIVRAEKEAHTLQHSCDNQLGVRRRLHEQHSRSGHEQKRKQ